MIEQLRPGASAERARVALFDFDGTLSVIRSGWVDVMVPMMVEILADLKSGESEEQLTAIVKEYVGRLTGKQTIYQMIELRDQFMRATDDATKKKLADQMHGRMYEIGTHVAVGEFQQPMAARKNISGFFVTNGNIYWNLKKGM